MRSFAIAALFGSAVACASLAGQTLTEHAAAAAGGTIGTAAGKPISSALGNVFGALNNSSTKATARPATKTTTKASTKQQAAGKPSPLEVPEKTGHTATVGLSPDSADAGGSEGGSGSKGRLAHRSAAPRETSARREAVEAAAPLRPIVPVVTEPLVKEPTTQELDSISVGTPASELRSALGAPESKVSIPDDDGHLRETLQYWANGEQIGTVHLDNGRVVSVQTSR